MVYIGSRFIIKKIPILFLLITSCIIPSTCASQLTKKNSVLLPLINEADKIKTISFTNENTISKKRVAIIGGVTGLSLGASFIYLNNVWWSDNRTTFHFDGGRGIENIFRLGKDGKYAKNLDKVGHFLGGAISAGLLSNSLQWAGINSGKEYLWAGLMGTAIQGFIEFKDGYAPNWGFSIYDMITGSLGSFYPYLQSKSNFFSAVDLKFSYYKRNNYYRNITGRGHWNDDYINQTYWFTFNPHRYKDVSKWPKWLGISVGLGVDNRLNNYYLRMPNGENDFGKGGYELFISPDLDLREILPKRKFWQRTARVLNFIKIPAPTLRISHQTKFLPLYF